MAEDPSPQVKEFLDQNQREIEAMRRRVEERERVKKERAKEAERVTNLRR